CGEEPGVVLGRVALDPEVQEVAAGEEGRAVPGELEVVDAGVHGRRGLHAGAAVAAEVTAVVGQRAEGGDRGSGGRVELGQGRGGRGSQVGEGPAEGEVVAGRGQHGGGGRDVAGGGSGGLSATR